MNLTNRRDRIVAWLLEHPEAIVDVPSDQDDVTDVNRPGLQALADALTAAGFYSHGSKGAEKLWSVRIAVGIAREAATKVEA
jgi:hypothetical protein